MPVHFVELAHGTYATGAHPSPPDDRDYPYDRQRIGAPETPPASVDLRGLVSEVDDQLRWGTCVANGTTKMFQVLRRVVRKGNIARSRAFVYFEGRLREGNVQDDAGMAPRDALQVLVDLGCPTEHEEPYATRPDFYRVPPTARQVRDAHKVRLGSYHALRSDAEIMATLAAQCPVPIVVAAAQWGGVGAEGIIPDSILADRDYDHCVDLIGYDANWWYVLNSWGTAFADGGYMYIPRSAGDLLATGIIAEAWAAAL